MNPFKTLLDVFRRPNDVRDPEETVRLRLEFRERYHWFRRLLRANRGALNDIAAIQELLYGDEPFSMVRVRTLSAHVSLEVWKIVDSMTRLAPGKYDALKERMHEIQGELNSHLAPAREPKKGPYILHVDDMTLANAEEVGSKIAVLGEIQNVLGLPAPKGFAVTASGFHRFMRSNELGEEIDRRIRSANATSLDEMHALSSDIQDLIAGSPLPEDLENAFLEAASRYGGHMAVRSSSLFEDGAETSFAGLHRSEVNVAPENLRTAYKDVVASLYSLPAMTHRLNRGIPDYDSVMAVGVLQMVDCRAGGVLYTRNPLGGKPGMVVNSVLGLPKAVVEGRCAGDVFRVSEDASQVLEKQVTDKDCKYTSLPEEGVSRDPVEPEEVHAPSISDKEVLALATMALRLESHFGGPQDVEWAIDQCSHVVLLQSRPLQASPVPLEAETHDSEELNDGGGVLLRGGGPASKGVAGGKVKVVRKTLDMLDFPKHGVLVVHQALPELASLLGRINAVVAETGSVVGHLANVCREYSIPAIFGLEGAVDALEDGMEVTVDADRCMVLPDLPPPKRSKKKQPSKPGSVDPGATAETDGQPDWEEDGDEGEDSISWQSLDTPIRRALAEAASFITPLNLLDPSSPHFRIKNVRTYHDITRYCHEKAVHEMFRFGRDHHFPERSSKQLFTHAATRWWVLNLENAFSVEEPGKFVRLEHIACKPMLALWEGVTAAPWTGPPPIDGGGFLAVMFRSTTDRSLAAGAPPKQAERNYFMISEHYCCMTTRLGYHFCTVETLVTGRPSESYASFQFQGGAADDDRRIRRVQLIGSLLEDYGFNSEIRDDNLTSRISGRPPEEMFHALRVLGYLVIHTRQIDMVMSSEADVSRYTSKIRKDIEEVFAGSEPLSWVKEQNKPEKERATQ